MATNYYRDAKGVEPEAKDFMRAVDLQLRAGGDVEKMVRLASNMNRAIGIDAKGENKRTRRLKAMLLTYPGELGLRLAAEFTSPAYKLEVA